MPPPATFADGTFPAGEIAPGTYRTTTLTDSCLWRLEDERSLGHPVRSRGASEIVEIPAGYSTFSSEGCGTWSTDLVPIITPGQPFGDGTYLVGDEIAPGRYRTISSSDSCSWQATGQFGRYTERVAFDAYEIRTAGSSVVVDIAPGDLAFRSYGCGTWTNDLTPIVGPGQPFGEGAYLVGSEIAPGRYRSTSSTRTCLWARLNSFRWTVAGKYNRGDAAYLGYWDDHGSGDESIVTIASADAGFVSYGCGSWLPFTTVIEPGQPFGGGTFLVGDEVPPGRYRTTSYSDDCVWQRFSGSAGDLSYIQWGDTTIVDIEQTDGAFDSHGCGTWSSDMSSSIAPGRPFGGGTYLVGDEITPGRYRSVSPSDDCVWERMSGVRGSSDEVISHRWIYRDLRLVAKVGASVIVDIAPTDMFFHSAGCGTWSTDLTPIVTPGQPFGDGTFLVGSEIAPGRYRPTSPGVGCWWDHLSDFSSGIPYPSVQAGNVIERSAEGGAVHIAPQDAGFRSGGCGMWTPVP